MNTLARAHRRLQSWPRLLLAGLAALGVVGLAWKPLTTPHARLTYNPSHSIEVGWYWLQPVRGHQAAALAVGDIVLVSLPDQVAGLAEQRGYLPRRIPALKRVAAAAPSQVCIKYGLVSIDSESVARVRALDRAGRVLPAWRHCRQLRAGELFLLSANNPDSFDSRYFGPVDARRVLAQAHPLWLEKRR